METRTMAEHWSEMLLLLNNEVSAVSYSTWLAPLVPIALTETRLTLTAPEEYIKRTVTSRYLSLIMNAAFVVLKKPIEVEVLLKNEMPSPMPEPIAPQLTLNPKYTFESFVVGSANRFAHAASLAVAESPADTYNPLFLYGGVGLGKTHLMHAIGHQIVKERPTARVLYVTSEQFTNELIHAIIAKSAGKADNETATSEFRNRFRGVDVLLVDDIQFIVGKERTQEEFFHTFNQLHSNGKQIVISSDRPPKDIPTLEERLRSRFEWGLIADIQKPDYETRLAILRKKAESERIKVHNDVLEYIAEHVASNIRELEGSLTRVEAYALLSSQPITLANAEEALKTIFDTKENKKITVDLILKQVTSFYSVSLEDIKSQRRSREVTLPRQVAMMLARELTDLSLPRIGEAFGGRDHTTVMHACDKIQQLVQKDAVMRNTIDDLRRMVKEM